MTHEPRNLIRFWICVVVGVALWFSPPPPNLGVDAWHVFAVFAATIVSFLLRPLPMGVCVLIGLLVLSASGCLMPAFTIDTSAPPVPRALPTHPDAKPYTPTDLSARADLAPQFVFHSQSERITTSFKAALSGFADDTVWLVVAAFFM